MAPMKKIMGVLAVANILALMSPVAASELVILHPNGLKNRIGSVVNGTLKPGALQSSLGNFGDFDYGIQITGRVHYPVKNKDGCRPFKEDDFDLNHLKEASIDGHRTIIMVDRGACHFVLKAMHIQKFGGILALVVDN